MLSEVLLLDGLRVWFADGGMNGSLFLMSAAGYLLGVFLAIPFANMSFVLSRSMYCLLVGLVICIDSLIRVSWGGVQILHGAPWLPLCFPVLLSILVGAVLCHCAVARSRDIKGNGVLGFLAFVPFASLCFMMLPGSQASTLRSATRSDARFIRPEHAVILAVLLFSMIPIVRVSVPSFPLPGPTFQTEEQAHPQTTPVQDEAKSVSENFAALVEKKGLSGALDDLAAAMTTPVIVDDITTLVKVDVHDYQLRRFFVVNAEGTSIPPSIVELIKKRNCSWPLFSILLEHGVSIRESYSEVTGRHVGDVIVRHTDCLDGVAAGAE